jgi:hypothetical protein
MREVDEGRGGPMRRVEEKGTGPEALVNPRRHEEYFLDGINTSSFSTRNEE